MGFAGFFPLGLRIKRGVADFARWKCTLSILTSTDNKEQKL